MKLDKAIKTGMKVYKTLDKMSGSNKKDEMDSDEKRETAIQAVLLVLVSTIEKMREKIANIQITIKKKKNEDEDEFEERCQEKREEKIEKICGNTFIVYSHGIIKAVKETYNDYDGIIVSDMDILAYQDEICNPEIDAESIAKKITEDVEEENWENAVDYDTSVKRFRAAGLSVSSASHNIQSLPSIPSAQASSSSLGEASANKIAGGCTLLIFGIIAVLILWIIC